jgi:hypothetical protein
VDRLGAAGTFTRVVVLGRDGALATPLLPGLSIPLDGLFAV